MNFKTTIFLLGALIAVGVFMLMTKGTATPSSDKDVAPAGPDSGVRLLDISSSSVNRLHITNATGSNVTVQKDKTTGAWRMTEPVSASAQDINVKSLLDEILNIQSKGRPDTDPGTQAGLDKPRFHIEIGTDDGKSTILDLGGSAGVGDMMYARVNNSDINLVPSSIERTLKTAGDNLRDKKLLAINGSEVQQFRITSGGKSVSAAKVNGTWKIVEPTSLPGDDDSIRTLLDAITTMEANSFVKGDAPEIIFAGFSNPTMTVWLGTTSPTTQPATTVPSNAPGGMTLTIGNPATISKDMYYVQLADGTIAKITSSSMQSMQKTSTDLRDKNIVTIPPSDVQIFAVEKDTYPAPATKPSTGPSTVPEQAVAATMPTSTKNTVLARRPPRPVSAQPTTVASTESASTQSSSTQAAATSQPATQPAPQSTWQLAADSDADVDDARVSLLLGTFSPLRADKWVDAVPTTQPSVKYTVDLTMKSASATEQPVVHHFEIFKTGDDTNYYTIYNGMTFVVSSSLIDQLDADYHKSAATPPPMTGSSPMPFQMPPGQ